MEIKISHLTKIFPNKKTGEEVRAVDDLNITIPSGKLIGLLGPSGCGKSTTLYMISGLLSPTEGQIFFGEDDVTKLAPEKRGIGLVFQNYALYPHMTVFQNIRFPLENLKRAKEVETETGEKITNYSKMSKAEMEEEVIKVAKLVQIEELLDRKPSQLSGGQQQRVAIARALVKKPRVLLLDEPLSNLDARLRLQTREEIKRIQRETGITTIFVTHDQEEAMSISDEIVVMNFGVSQQMDDPQKVYEDPTNMFVARFLGTPPINLFDGEIKNEKVYIGNEALFTKKLPDQKIKIGVRPEGFILNNLGVFSADIDFVERIGRDVSIIAKHENCLNESFRVIVDADSAIPAKKVKLNLKPNKTFLFDYDTGERIK
ncbi:MAG: ABC transporter ATP-binding protein [Erysipelotrichales bacterium]|nr:ABC transporter ATP-binding protein [Erysipelotrichales bacterium]